MGGGIGFDMTADDADLSLVVTLRYWREEDNWVGKCDELGVSTFDPSLDTLVTELQEMAEDHIALLQETGTLDDFLERFGISPESGGVASRSLEVAANSTSDLVQIHKLRIGQLTHSA